MGRSTGKPKFLNDDQEKKLFEVVTTKTPNEVGFENRKNWDCNLIAHWILNTYGVKLLGILDYETGRIICSEEERYDVHPFLRFL
ncbi:hypothetical protein F3D3_2969 [Fusibacter sp. 3D3]|nr:hypothetical protein F3D3_2969 [Fusibacter sp. 3D3]